jgi:protein ImuB
MDGRTTGIEAGLSVPVATPKHLLRLLKERGLERLDLGFGADALMLAAHKAEAVTARQAELGAGKEAEGREALAALIDRLAARLGDGAILSPALKDSHIPERSEAWGPASPDPPVPVADPGSDGPRPLFLLDPPEPIEAMAELPDSAPVRFSWRRVTRKVAKAEGPERLGPEWWSKSVPAATERTRDYYRVEDEDGRRYWLFREGLYERPESDRLPAWWLHGVFA